METKEIFGQQHHKNNFENNLKTIDLSMLFVLYWIILQMYL
jgi:hypothetical protein